MDEEALVEQIQNLLPQTQCERCGHAGCLPYAQALARGQAAINQCPPGGQAGVEALANLLGRPVLPLDPRFGQEGPLELVEIEEDHCIGCTLCIQACPVDAIVGAPKQMHTVLTELCTGCQLCVAPCPVDCIVVRPAPFGWDRARARSARARFEGRARRLLERAAALRARTALEAHHRAMRHALDPGMADIPNAPDPLDAGAAERKRAVLARALARARARTIAQELSEQRKELEAHASAPASRIEPD